MAIRKTAGYAWNLISLIGMILAVTAASLIIVFSLLRRLPVLNTPTWES